MAMEIPLTTDATSFELDADEAFERAATTWFEARRRFASVDPAALSASTRSAYELLMVRIGLWADAQFDGAPIAIDTEVAEDLAAIG